MVGKVAGIDIVIMETVANAKVKALASAVGLVYQADTCGNVFARKPELELNAAGGDGKAAVIAENANLLGNGGVGEHKLAIGY